MEKAKQYFIWFMQTSQIIGVPVTLIILILAAQSIFYTGACYTTDYYCEYALGADKTAEAIQTMLDANPGKDMIMKPRGR